MDIKWAVRQLKKMQPVRRKAWKLGEYVGNDGALFYCCAHEETYNAPSVSVRFDYTFEDILANDWEKVAILPPHGYVVESKYTDYQHFFWTEREAKQFQKKHKGTIKKVSNGLFGWPGKERYS